MYLRPFRLLPSATKLRRLVFTFVCLSTGAVVSQHALQQVSGGEFLLPGGAYSGWGCLLLGCVGGGDPPGQQTATVADGTHPTGMHSCSYKSILTSVAGSRRRNGYLMAMRVNNCKGMSASLQTELGKISIGDGHFRLHL